MRNRAIRAPQADPNSADPGPLEAALRALRAKQGLPTEYPAAAVAEAQQAAASVQLPERDETAVPFFTIDPEGSKDLDQAMWLERDGDGYRVRYAIADVPAYVTPGGALDAETRKRGETIYLPDERIPLHPEVLSEGAASLLPDQVRPAFVWDLRLAADGTTTAAEVYLAKVSSKQRLDYLGVQRDIDSGSAAEALMLLKEIGEKRIALERARGGASLPMPEQEVRRGDDGRYELSFRPPVPAEDWNAQISLMTGMAAADLMLRAKIGILRTMPAPDQNSIARFRRQAAALGVPWQEGLPYGEFIRSLDRTNPKHLALIHEATGLFRGAGYTAFDGQVPADPQQAAVAAPYAHVTAPLRRLVDRFGLVVCEAVSRGAEVPAWVREALPTLPEVMKEADQRARQAERASTDIVEAAVLQARVGETFAASVVDQSKDAVDVQLTDLAVVARCTGQAALGASVTVRLVKADLASGQVEFALA
ncbi:RNB domain-containing ribonuclease [Calidifontibacter sp. DB0510]|uniref:RNB domain-containing ribonuclease n=1 Tax=Metallococcus carri TaxID=1656884 RepID=A0A967B4S7_9MICO|nr:RNB domain-containing ribonuclease [Metallococcus carri]NHN57350.1 RNB domain-containing ribonuclease [Metallococcus carri]NOP39128.1 RNB domain-containing ribonuclease [Calidifontibacter sp. DB2511S]